MFKSTNRKKLEQALHDATAPADIAAVAQELNKLLASEDRAKARNRRKKKAEPAKPAFNPDAEYDGNEPFELEANTAPIPIASKMADNPNALDAPKPQPPVRDPEPERQHEPNLADWRPDGTGGFTRTIEAGAHPSDWYAKSSVGPDNEQAGIFPFINETVRSVNYSAARGFDRVIKLPDGRMLRTCEKEIEAIAAERKRRGE